VALLAGCGATPSAKPGQSGGVSDGGAPAAAKTISFAADVKPILDKHCADCHLSGASKGGYSMDTRESTLAPGRNGARIVEGNGAGSNLILRVAHDPSVKKMPPKGDALSAAEVDTLKAWIDQGVKWE
jgi:mono/diheme cytochrome c family protein